MCELLEVFSVCCRNGVILSGTISVFDGKRGQIIYGGRDRANQKASQKKPSNSCPQNEQQTSNLLLTGPHRAISADGCVAIELDLRHQGCKSKYVANILLDVYDPETIYDETVTKVVSTCICKDSPSAEVTYALLSNAVEAVVQVKLLERRDNHPIYGKIIVAHTDLCEVVLFESHDEEDGDTRVASSTIIPLTRSVLAVPLTSSLKIEVHLRIPSTGEIRKDLVECKPHLDSEDHLVGQNGLVQVNITWSD